MKQISLIVNGHSVSIAADERRPLLLVLREDLGLTGGKIGCGEGECGACTVLADGRPVRACITPLGDVAGCELLTIEGLAAGGQLHPLQQAFLDAEALQCGYCTPGMIMAALGLLLACPDPDSDAIVAAMQGNLCRCGTYPRIVRAMQQAARELRDEPAQGGIAMTNRPREPPRAANPAVPAPGAGRARRAEHRRLACYRAGWQDRGYTGKTEMGQNIRTSLAQAVAEELRVPVDAIELVMADTARTPYDMGTVGSRTTPVMAAQLRQVAAATRELLLALAADGCRSRSSRCSWRVEQPATPPPAQAELWGAGEWGQR